MTAPLPRLARRASAALLVAAVLLAGLQLGATAWAGARPPAGLRPAFVPSPLAGLPLVLVPASGAVLLARSPQAFAPAVRPVLELGADGALAVRRPAAGGEHAAGPDDVGVVLPDAELGAWTPAARAALVALLGAWLVERPVRGDRVRVVDGALTPAQVALLASWIP
jgi:hypothetical protein